MNQWMAAKSKSKCMSSAALMFTHLGQSGFARSKLGWAGGTDGSLLAVSAQLVATLAIVSLLTLKTVSPKYVLSMSGVWISTG